jgi:hypothetical protein
MFVTFWLPPPPPPLPNRLLTFSFAVVAMPETAAATGESP